MTWGKKSPSLIISSNLFISIDQRSVYFHTYIFIYILILFLFHSIIIFYGIFFFSSFHWILWIFPRGDPPFFLFLLIPPHSAAVQIRLSDWVVLCVGWRFVSAWTRVQEWWDFFARFIALCGKKGVAPEARRPGCPSSKQCLCKRATNQHLLQTWLSVLPAAEPRVSVRPRPPLSRYSAEIYLPTSSLTIHPHTHTPSTTKSAQLLLVNWTPISSHSK